MPSPWASARSGRGLAGRLLGLEEGRGPRAVNARWLCVCSHTHARVGRRVHGAGLQRGCLDMGSEDDAGDGPHQRSSSRSGKEW